jgi:hypothetical protein
MSDSSSITRILFFDFRLAATNPTPLQILRLPSPTLALDPYFQIELHRLPVEYYQQFEDIQEFRS